MNFQLGRAKVFGIGSSVNDVESKATILNAIRSASVRPVELPDLSDVGIVFDDPIERFSKVLARVGGTAIRVPDTSQLGERIRGLEVFQPTQQVLWAIDDQNHGNVDLSQIEDPRELNDLAIAVLPGMFGVAENAAVWVTDNNLKHRVVYVMAEHLVLVVACDQILHNMHQAYERLRFDEPSYGLFISGPSKTADIGATLVKGAQGAKTLHVLLVGG